jgi:hypothetical protein
MRVVEPRKPDLIDLDLLEFVLAVDESTQVVVVLMGSDNYVDLGVAKVFLDLRRDLFQALD